MKYSLRALKFLLNYLPITIGGGIALILVNVANLITPQVLRYLIDDGIIPLDLSKVWIAAGLLILVALIRGTFNFFQGYWGEVASQGVAFDLRNLIFEKLQNLSFSYHDRSQTGKLMTRMTSDVELVRNFVGRGILMMISAMLMILGTLIIMFFMNWKLALLTFLIIPFILSFFGYFIRKIIPISREVQKKLGALNTILQENLAGISVVKAFAREDYEYDRFTEQNITLLNENINMVKLFSAAFPLVFYIANLGMVAVIWFGGLQVIDLNLSLGELVAFTGYLGILLMPIFQLGMIGAMLSRAEASSERIFEVVDSKSEVTDKPDAIELPQLDGNVIFDKVSFRYIGTENDILSDVSFEAKTGETIAILGQTGSGKSTIINLIPRFYDVTDGKVIIDGYDVRDVTLDSLRSQIGIVLQETTLFSGSIRDNISYGRPNASIEDIINAAKAAQAHEFITELEDSYSSKVGERGVGLSGGQKQRIAIARALLVNPRILILDDSTSSVDAETEFKIQQALEKLMLGRTSFVIAQRISTVRNADKIILLDKGKLSAIGTHNDLMNSNELYVEILQTQFGDKAELMAVVEEKMKI